MLFVFLQPYEITLTTFLLTIRRSHNIIKHLMYDATGKTPKTDAGVFVGEKHAHYT